MKEPQCPAQDANGEGSASSTTSTSQESGQNEPLAESRPWNIPPPDFSIYAEKTEISPKLDQLIALQIEANELHREGNSLLLALIEAMGQDPDPEELHIPRPL